MYGEIFLFGEILESLNKSRHFSNTTGIVRNGTVSVDSEGNREATKHAEGREGNTVHSTEGKWDVDGDGNAEHWDNAWEVDFS